MAHFPWDPHMSMLTGTASSGRCLGGSRGPNYAFAGIVVRLANMRARGMSGPSYIGVDPLQNGTIAPALAGAAHTDHIFTTSRSAIQLPRDPLQSLEESPERWRTTARTVHPGTP